MTQNSPFNRAGVAFGLVQAVFSSAMALLASSAPDALQGADIVLHRSVFIVILLLPLVYKELPTLFIPTAKIVWARAGFGAIGILCLFHNLAHSSAALAAMLSSLSPALTVVLAVVFAGERISRQQAIGCGICVLGVLGIRVAPGFEADGTSLAIGFVGAFSTAAAFVALRRSSRQHSALLVVWVLSFVTVLLALPMAELSRVIDFASHWVLLSVALTSMLAQVFLTLCYRHLPAWSAVIVTRASLLFVSAGEWLVQRRWPGVIEIAVLVTIACGLLVIQTGKDHPN